MSRAITGPAQDGPLRRAVAWLTDAPGRIYDATVDTGAWPTPVWITF